MFVNLTNHPSGQWSEAQRNAALRYASEIIDLPFPDVPSDASREAVIALSEQYIQKIKKMGPTVVLCQGEMTLTYLIVKRLIEFGIPAIAACSERQTVETVDADGNTHRISKFVFRQFRPYGDG